MKKREIGDAYLKAKFMQGHVNDLLHWNIAGDWDGCKLNRHSGRMRKRTFMDLKMLLYKYGSQHYTTDSFSSMILWYRVSNFKMRCYKPLLTKCKIQMYETQQIAQNADKIKNAYLE